MCGVQMFFFNVFFPNAVLASLVPRKFMEASQDRTGRSMRALFSQYIECNEDWMSSVLVICTENTEREQTRGTYKWLTKMDSW